MKNRAYTVSCARVEGNMHHHVWSGSWEAQNPIQALAMATTGDGVSLQGVGPLMPDQGGGARLELYMNGFIWEVF